MRGSNSCEDNVDGGGGRRPKRSWIDKAKRGVERSADNGGRRTVEIYDKMERHS